LELPEDAKAPISSSKQGLSHRQAGELLAPSLYQNQLNPRAKEARKPSLTAKSLMDDLD